MMACDASIAVAHSGRHNPANEFLIDGDIVLSRAQRSDPIGERAVDGYAGRFRFGLRWKSGRIHNPTKMLDPLAFVEMGRGELDGVL